MKRERERRGEGERQQLFKKKKKSRKASAADVERGNEERLRLFCSEPGSMQKESEREREFNSTSHDALIMYFTATAFSAFHARLLVCV